MYGTREEPGTVTQGGILFSLVPLVWESNPKLQGGGAPPPCKTQPPAHRKEMCVRGSLGKMKMVFRPPPACRPAVDAKGGAATVRPRTIIACSIPGARATFLIAVARAAGAQALRYQRVGDADTARATGAHEAGSGKKESVRSRARACSRANICRLHRGDDLHR